MTEATAKERETLTKNLHDWVTITIDQDGFWPGSCIGLTDDDALVMASLAITGDFVFVNSMMAAYKLIGEQKLKECIVGLDFFAKPGQGIEFDDFVGVFYWTGQLDWNYGVIPYQKPKTKLKDEEKVIRDVNMNHPFWTPRLKELHCMFREKYKTPPPKVIGKDGNVRYY